MPKDQPQANFSLKDIIMIVGAVGAILFHAGTFYAVKDKVEKHDTAIEALKTDSNRQQIDIEILNVRYAKRGHR